MQTTLRIKDEVYHRAKSKAGELGLSLTRFFEEAVEERLLKLEQRPVRRIVLPVCSVSGPALSEAEFFRRVDAAELAADQPK